MKAYAVKHNLSVFNVIKMLKSGKLKSSIEEEEGKKTTYILLDDNIEKEVKKSIVPLDKYGDRTVREELKELREELRILKIDLEVLKKAVL